MLPLFAESMTKTELKIRFTRSRTAESSDANSTEDPQNMRARDGAAGALTGGRHCGRAPSGTQVLTARRKRFVIVGS